MVHAVFCLRGARPGHRFSERHNKQDETNAELLLSGCGETGYALTPTDS